MRTRLVLAIAALLALSACFDPIVGTQCALGYSPCGGKCVLAGSCDMRDAGEEEDAASSDDGGTTDDAGIADDAGGDDASPPPCLEPLTICSDQCVDPMTDPENCGGCNTLCPSSVCIDGGCLACAPEESVCGQQCINTGSDPDNCGGCGVLCASGLCSNSRCEAAGTGRVIVIGHDYLRNRPAMNRILGNAVFLWPVNPVHLLAYQGAANPIAITGADTAIAQVAASTGRQVQRTDVAAQDVATQLAAADVFLIYGQEQASAATLPQLGQDWAGAATTFVNRGGTLILLDALYSANLGTVQILSQAGLFALSRQASTTDAVCTVAAPGDALASGLPKTYRCEQNSVDFTTTEVGSAVTSVVESGMSVVIDKVF